MRTRKCFVITYILWDSIARGHEFLCQVVVYTRTDWIGRSASIFCSKLSKNPKYAYFTSPTVLISQKTSPYMDKSQQKVRGVAPPPSPAGLANAELGLRILAFTEDKNASSYILDSPHDPYAHVPTVGINKSKARRGLRAPCLTTQHVHACVTGSLDHGGVSSGPEKSPSDLILYSIALGSCHFTPLLSMYLRVQ